jgi:hypothetical protein
MSDQDTHDLTEKTLTVALSVGTVTGLNLPVYRRRTAENIAEVARLSGEHQAMIAEIDRFAQSRTSGYDDKSTELFMNTPDVLQAKIPVSPMTAKQNEE